jgi:hypothetical protein
MRFARLALTAAFAASFGAGNALATAAPLSDIPWLSESVTTAPSGPPARPSSAVPPPVRGTEEISVTPLGAVSKEAAGLLAPDVTGFSKALWGSSDPAVLRELIGGLSNSGVPAAQALFRRILMAEAEPPRAGPDSGLLMTRIDRLLAMGALPEAAALVEMAEADTPDLFRRWFDIGLLTDEAQQPCEALRRNPTLSPTLPARVFCLARGGDWNAAEITLTIGGEVGSITDEQYALLARFLDPDLFEGEPEPPVADPLTPIDFLMREAIGLPRPAVILPLAFLHHDLSEHAPMRMRVEAAERLALAGSVSADVLREAYLAGTPAASGGIWSRAEAVQNLEAALDAGTSAEIGAALIRADDALAERGLRTAFARFEAERLAGIDAAGLEPAERSRLFELLVLAEEVDAAAGAAAEDAESAFVLALARGDGVLPAAPEGLVLAAAVRSGLAPREPSDLRERRLRDLIGAGNEGEALLEALELLEAGGDVDPSSLQAALHVLTGAGQDTVARRIAVQTLLARPAGPPE